MRRPFPRTLIVVFAGAVLVVTGAAAITIAEPSHDGKTPGPTTAPRPPGERTVQAYVTGYTWHDNSPPGSPQVSHPVIHRVAGGTGTYADPITVAVGHSINDGADILDWAAGTRFYIEDVHRYFIVEDTCGDGPRPQNGACHTGFPRDAAGASTWLDVWIDGRDATHDGATVCAEGLTGVHPVIVDPSSGYPVDDGPILHEGRCAAEHGERPR